MEETLLLSVVVAVGGWVVPLFSSMVVARFILVGFRRFVRREAYAVKYAAYAASMAVFTAAVVFLARMPHVGPVWLWIAYGWSFSSSLSSLVDADRQRVVQRRAARAGGILLRRGRRWRIMWRYRAIDRYRRGKTSVARWMPARPSLRDGV